MFFNSRHSYVYHLCSSSHRLVLYYYQAEFIHGLIKKNGLARSFNFMFRYVDDAIPLNSSMFSDFVDGIYPIELVIMDTTDTTRSASYLDIYLATESDIWLRTKY